MICEVKCPVCGENGTHVIDCLEVTGAAVVKDGLKVEGVIRSDHYECQNNHQWTLRKKTMEVPGLWKMQAWTEPVLELPEPAKK